jgi:putative glutamine amidotransferase
MERVRWAAWDVTVTMAPRTYVRAVQEAGAIAWLMPPDRAAPDDPGAWLDRTDALLFAGGSDVHPALYGAEADPHTSHTWPDRDNFEVTVLSEALARGIPVLGICRGMQLINVGLGGTLVQHLPDVLGGDRHLHTPGQYSDHDVHFERGSLAERVIGAERTSVKSHHHQGVDELGESLVASGWSVEDDLVEAIEIPDAPFALGVLWHPEEDERSRVIGALVEAVR